MSDLEKLKSCFDDLGIDYSTDDYQGSIILLVHDIIVGDSGSEPSFLFKKDGAIFN